MSQECTELRPLLVEDPRVAVIAVGESRRRRVALGECRSRRIILFERVRSSWIACDRSRSVTIGHDRAGVGPQYARIESPISSTNEPVNGRESQRMRKVRGALRGMAKGRGRQKTTVGSTVGSTRKPARRPAVHSNSRRYDPVDWDVAIRLYRDDRWTIAAVARKSGVSWKVMRRGLLEHGVTLRRLARVDREDTIALYHAWHRVKKVSGRSLAWPDFREFRDEAMKRGFKKGLVSLIPDSKRPPSSTNLVWVTRSHAAKIRDQMRPKPPRSAITAFGETKTLAAWMRDRRVKVSRPVVSIRLKEGVNAETALTAEAGVPLAKLKTGAKGASESRPLAEAPSDRSKRLRVTIDWKRAARLYKRGMPPPKIASAVGCSLSGLHAGLRRRGVVERQRKGLTATPTGRTLNHIWVKMKRRCELAARKPKRSATDKAMRIASAWREFERFYAWAVARGYEPGMRLVRVDPGKAYSQWNCRWETKTADG